MLLVLRADERHFRHPRMGKKFFRRFKTLIGTKAVCLGEIFPSLADRLRRGHDFHAFKIFNVRRIGMHSPPSAADYGDSYLLFHYSVPFAVRKIDK